MQIQFFSLKAMILRPNQKPEVLYRDRLPFYSIESARAHMESMFGKPSEIEGLLIYVGK